MRSVFKGRLGRIGILLLLCTLSTTALAESRRAFSPYLGLSLIGGRYSVNDGFLISGANDRHESGLSAALQVGFEIERRFFVEFSKRHVRYGNVDVLKFLGEENDDYKVRQYVATVGYSFDIGNSHYLGFHLNYVDARIRAEEGQSFFDDLIDPDAPRHRYDGKDSDIGAGLQLDVKTGPGIGLRLSYTRNHFEFGKTDMFVISGNYYF